MKTIAIFVKNLTSGGAEKQAVLLAKTLCLDYNVHFIIFNADKVHQKYMDSLQTEQKIKIAGFRGNHISRFKQLVNYLNQEKIDIIFSYLAAANLYACCAGLLTGAKVYTGIRNVDLPRKKRMMDYLLTNYIATGTIINCFSGKDNFKRYGFNAKRMFVIPNGFEDIHPWKMKTQKNIIHVITVGRFHPQKDYETAIRSFAKLHEACPNTEYDIVGYGDEEVAIRSLIHKLHLDNCCNIYINPNNISELLENADIYLSTSLVEGTSNSIMEAMNANLPVVATNVGDNCYLVDNGYSGYILPTKDVNEIADKLIVLANNTELRAKMGSSAKKILQTNYSIETFKKKYIEIINQTR